MSIKKVLLQTGEKLPVIIRNVPGKRVKNRGGLFRSRSGNAVCPDGG